MLFSRKKDKRVYLDYAASTPVCKEARTAMQEVLDTHGNPGALHSEGVEAARIRDAARSRAAKHLGVKASELVFVSGGTEGNNLTLLGFFAALEKAGKDISTLHLVTSSIEHSSVLEVARVLEKRGVDVSYVEPNEKGVIRPEVVKDALKDNTVFVSIGLVNGEIGTVQPLHAISKVVKTFREDITMHSDACQGMYASLVPQGLGLDLMTLDSTKMYGPRGTGVLYIKKGTDIEPLFFGGEQERGLRPGTENTMLYAGFAAAFDRVITTRKEERERLMNLRAEMINSIQESIPDAVINGTSKEQTPHILNVSVPNIDAEYTALYLDARGVALSTKSACKEKGGGDESHVVKALGDKTWRAKNTLRFSFGSDTEESDVVRVVELLKEAVEKQRGFSKKS